MRYEVLTNYFGQHVEVSILSKTFSGVIRRAEADSGQNDIVEVEPISDYHRKRYGSAVLDVETITSIRMVKPYNDDEDDDCSDSAI